jgi:purine nucleoside phosphorylase
MHKKTIGIIAGTGLVQSLDTTIKNIKKYTNVKNKYGVVLSYYVGEYKNLRVIIIPRHGDSINTPSRSPFELVNENGYEANIWQLHQEKVDYIISLSAVGCLDRNIPLSNKKCFIIPNQYIRGFSSSQHSFGGDAINVHSNMSSPFNEDLRKIIIKAITSFENKAYSNAVYIYNGGDIFETSAEIKVLDKLTKDLFKERVVGMTTVPECILSNQLNIPYAVICSNVNYAEGLSLKKVDHKGTLDVMKVASEEIVKITKKILDII